MDSSLKTKWNSLHEEINAHIDKLSFELKKFSKLLKFENDALHNRNYDELTQASEEKTFLIKNITRVDHALKSVFHDNQRETTLQDYINGMPSNSHLKAKWSEQMQILEKCNKQNSENKKLVDSYINDIHSIIDIIDMSNNPQTYNQSGSTQYTNETGSSYSSRI